MHATNSITKSAITILSAVLLIGFFAFSQNMRAVTPAPDGGYAGNNTAEGTSALFSLTSGLDNTALGYQSLFHQTSGTYNTATGFRALFSNTTGTQNTATGLNALISNTIGGFNTANGVNALYRNATGMNNTANGVQALYSNTNGAQNTANGSSALFANTTGAFNTATGFNALAHTIGGSSNTANGHAALFNNTSGSNNVAVGRLAGSNLNTGDNNIDIGYNVPGVAGESNTIRIGNTDITDTYIRGISGATSAGGVAVFVNGNGKLGTTTSSARFKDEIKPMGKASEAILALRPVSFRYKKEIDPQGIPEFGLIAEEVEKVSPDLIIRDKEGKPYTVRYEQVNAMLLNEFLKEHGKVEELQATVARQQKEMETVISRLKDQEAKIQKVSARLEVTTAAPRTVASE